MKPIVRRNVWLLLGALIFALVILFLHVCSGVGIKYTFGSDVLYIPREELVYMILPGYTFLIDEIVFYIVMGAFVWLVIHYERCGKIELFTVVKYFSWALLCFMALLIIACLLLKLILLFFTHEELVDRFSADTVCEACRMSSEFELNCFEVYYLYFLVLMVQFVDNIRMAKHQKSD